MNPAHKTFRSQPPVLTLLPAIQRDLSDCYVEGPDGDLYFRTLAPDSPCREYWEGGDFVFQLTTPDQRKWLACSGVEAPRRQDWVAVA